MVRVAIAKNPKISSSTALLLTKDTSRQIRQHLAMISFAKQKLNQLQ